MSRKSETERQKSEKERYYGETKNSILHCIILQENFISHSIICILT